MTEKEFAVDQRVRLLVSVWDDGCDNHHPPGYLARKGEELIVRKIDPGHEFPICVSHEQITDNSFRVALSEIEAIKEQP